MAGFETNNTQHLIRAQLWSNDLKKMFEDELIGTKYVKMITDFGDGEVLNIPSIGQAEVLDYKEGEAVRYTSMDTGNFTFSINRYKSSATFITRKMLQDSFYASQLVSEFVPAQHRAIMKNMETDILAAMPDGQTAGDQNKINGASHRWVGQGTNGQISVNDFIAARYALQKANVPMTNLVAIVDPTVEFTLASDVGLNGLAYNPRWEGIIDSGISTGMKFLVNIHGFDVYTSQNLKQGISETIDGRSVTNGVANLFFSAVPEALPLVGAIRQAPIVDSEFNKDLQREEYITTARWGFKMFRPENAITVLTNVDGVVPV